MRAYLVRRAFAECVDTRRSHMESIS